jgi:hypothetical protein
LAGNAPATGIFHELGMLDLGSVEHRRRGAHAADRYGTDLDRPFCCSVNRRVPSSIATVQGTLLPGTGWKPGASWLHAVCASPSATARAKVLIVVATLSLADCPPHAATAQQARTAAPVRPLVTSRAYLGLAGSGKSNRPSADITYQVPRHQASPGFRGFRERMTGLEPSTSCMASTPKTCNCVWFRGLRSSEVS